MTPERYREINALADAAQEMPLGERAAFLDGRCRGDDELRREVEQLLQAEASSGGFLQHALVETLARDLAAAAPKTALDGTVVGRYRVVSRVGAGGVGEVWLAQDVELNRNVALKLLSPVHAGDPAHIRRFRHEARAASRLNHPNIVTIYEIGKLGESEYIAQEFIYGDTIRQRIGRGRLSLPETLQIGIQAASALDSAHQAGIVHRDIKPENVMIRPDGLVKVLDFGLARFVERGPAAGSAVAQESITRPGFVLGTVRYMSPEQARGLDIDERSDIFSLGVMLYEMAAGVPPFSGATPADTLPAILHSAPPPLASHVPGANAALDRVIARCLEKDASKRYQNAGELRQELEAIQQDTGRGASSRRGRWAAAGAGLAVLLAVGVLVWRITTPRPSLNPFASMTMSRLATRGDAIEAAISPDGRSYAYVVGEAGGQTIWTRQIANSTETPAVRGQSGRHFGLAFSRDGSHLYYVRQTAEGGADLYRVPADGGRETRLVANVSGPAALSPDGRRLAFIRLDASRWEASLLVANADGTGEIVVATRRRPQYLDPNGVAWSPDSRSIAFFAGDAKSYAKAAYELDRIPAAGGTATRITAQKFGWPESLDWSAASGNLVVSATPLPGTVYQLWAVSPRDGAVWRITNDLGSYGRATAAAAGESIVAVQRETTADLWVAAAADPNAARRITAASLRFAPSAIAWTADGRIVHTNSDGDSREVWTTGADGGAERQLTTGPGNKDQPAVSPDGRYVVFVKDGNIWRMDVDGQHARRLTNGPLDVHPAVSPDSRWVVYTSFPDWSPSIGGEPRLWKTPMEGGEPVQISDFPASVASVSPGSARILCVYYPGKDPRYSSNRLAVTGWTGNDGFLILPQEHIAGAPVAWSPDGKSLDYVVNDSGVGNIWRIAVGGGPPRRITNFTADQLFAFAWSRDGRQLAYSRGRSATSVVRLQSGPASRGQ